MRRQLRQGAAAAETILALALAWVLVFTISFRRMAGWLGKVAPPRESQTADADTQLRAQVIGRRIARWSRRSPWRTTCLVQAVAGFLLLRRRGIHAAIRLGVKRDAHTFAAHAWLMVGGATVLGGQEAAGFSPLADIGKIGQESEG